MVSKHSEGGYVAEGGQLKALNGQKYVFNDQKEGYFLTKACAGVLIVAALFAMLGAVLLTYFLVAASCAQTNEVPQKSNDSIYHASFYNGYNNDQPDETPHTTTALPVKETEVPASTAPLTETTIKHLSTPPTTALTLAPEVANSNVDDDVESSRELLPPPADNITLYEGWSPSLYRIIIEPNFKTGRNNGTVEITIENDESLKEILPIVFDAKDIEIINPEIYEVHRTNKVVPFKSNYGDDGETYVLTLDHPYREAHYGKHVSLIVKMEFVSRLTDTLQGFYKIKYSDDHVSKDLNLASTQFSPIDARRAFPCFDRPDKKAQFELSVVRMNSMSMTLANAKENRQSPHRPGFTITDFALTPKMSTYLVAFIVSDLVKVNSTITPLPHQPHVTFWTRHEVADMTGYAHELTLNVLDFLGDYFGIKFNLDKIDMVAVPDFGFNAMENWGLITFRESALLIPKDSQNGSSAEHTARVSEIVSHELAHQWFGNLVTMKWWDDLWLKEGFATYMSYECMNKVQPTWRALESLVVNEMQKSMDKDSDESSHAISFPVVTKSDIRRIFDPISYSKGASMIRMMKSFLGEEAFRAGLTEYLKTFQYSNAVQDDLWEIMTKKGHQFKTLPQHLTVKEIMDTWTHQPGYPVLTISRHGSDLVISQHKYILPKSNPADTTRWFIPITFATETQQDSSEIPTHWMTNKDETIVIKDIVEEFAWLYVNVNRTAYYRVNYDQESWKYLSANYEHLPPVIRANIIDDSLNLARAELLGYDVPLTFLMRLGTTPNDYFAWDAASKSIDYLSNMLLREPAYELFKGIMKYISRTEYNNVGFETKANDTHLDLIHRTRIIKHACFFGYDRCTVQAQIIFRQWMTEPEKHQINPNLKNGIYCVALREGSTQEWYFALKQYTSTTNAGEKEIILNALGCTLKPWLLSKYLNMTISATSEIRKQDGARAFAAVAKNPIGYEIAFNFLMTNIKEISEYFGDGFSTLAKMVDAVTTFMNKDYQLGQFERFSKEATKLRLTGVAKSIQIAKVQVKNNIHWRNGAYYNLEKYLQQMVDDFKLNIY